MNLGVLSGFGMFAVLWLLNWWFRRDHVANPLLFWLLSLAFWYGISRIVLGWVNYTRITRSEHKIATSSRHVAIFTTSAPGEPLSMFEITLAACARVRYPHATYLLDDTGDPRFAEVAQRNNAVWLDLRNTPGAKAGKINRALGLTREEIILVLDPDHVPFPEFFDRVLGHFEDPQVGFVQVAQAYYNQSRSFTARGAAEQTYAFYGPVLMGLCALGGAVAIGANCTFRRKALESIGGHGIGLAEDLVTSIRLHAKKWKSVYVPEVVSRGLVPEDLGSFYKQQLKWARGVYEVAFTELPKLFPGLSWWQRLSYLTIGSYYLFGITAFLYLLFPYIYLWTGAQPASMSFLEFLLTSAPVGLVAVGMYLFVQKWMVHPAVESGIHWRGLMLKIACWPIFLIGTLLAIVRADIPYIPTAKEAVRGRFLRLAWPQLLLIVVYVVTLVHTVRVRMFGTTEGALELTSQAVWGMVLFATIPVVMSAGAIYAAWESRHPARGNPWDDINVKKLGGGT